MQMSGRTLGGHTILERQMTMWTHRALLGRGLASSAPTFEGACDIFSIQRAVHQTVRDMYYGARRAPSNGCRLCEGYAVCP